MSYHAAMSRPLSPSPRRVRAPAPRAPPRRLCHVPCPRLASARPAAARMVDARAPAHHAVPDSDDPPLKTAPQRARRRPRRPPSRWPVLRARARLRARRPLSSLSPPPRGTAVAVESPAGPISPSQVWRTWLSRRYAPPRRRLPSARGGSIYAAPPTAPRRESPRPAPAPAVPSPRPESFC